jgi:hypothetical protein
MGRKHQILSVFFFVALTVSVSGQEFRATVNGRVTDPSGLAVPGVTVTVQNLQTNEAASAVTGDTGNYAIPFLRPGVYSVSAELPGFKKFMRDQVTLSVGQTATIDVQLEVGEVTEAVTVTSEAPLLDQSKADRGMVIDNKRVTEIPLNARNPFMLSTLVPGITYNGPAIYQRPFDNGAIADWSINGGQNRNNEFLLDGAPNNSIQGGNNLAYVPTVDSVEEFKIITNSYDAQYGRTAGGVINVSLKSGTNRPHGTVYEFMRRQWLDANFLQINSQYTPTPGHPKPPKSGHFLDQYGFEFDAPVSIPKLYDGRDKTFFMVAFEKYKEGTPNPATLTYPDDRQINGDFSQLKDKNGNLITVYDPATGKDVNGQWVRDPFPRNVIPTNRIDPIAKKLLSFYPKPNFQTPGSDPWRDNYSFVPNIAFDTFHNFSTKVDQVIGEKDKVFFRYGYNLRAENRFFNAITSGPAQDGQLPLERQNHTGVFDWVRTFNPNLVLNVRISGNRYVELARSDPGLGFDATQLGFPKSLADQLPIKMFPRINVADYTNIGRGSFTDEPTNVFGFQPNVAIIRGTHTIRTGLDMRLTQYARLVSDNAGMRFEFNRTFTQKNFDRSDALSGNSIASMLLGAPAGGAIDNNAFPIFMWKYYAPWIQDDWKVTPRLTLNLGLRWDLSSPIKERYNRENRGFDPSVLNPITSKIDQTKFPGFQVKGGFGFAAVGGNPVYPWDWDKNNIQPRVGVAYRLNEKTVIRGGIGQYYLNPTGTGVRNGFSIQTPLVGSLDGNRTPLYNLANPFPDGVAQPPGSALGLLTFLGRGPSFSSVHYKLPYVFNFSLGVQRQLPWNSRMELSYVGSRTLKEQSQWNGYNEPSAAFRKLCDVTQGGSASFCNQLLPNPFFQVPGFEGTGRFTGTTISRFDLNRPFPQFTGFTEFERNDGKVWYDSLQIFAEKRMSSGLALAGTYTFSKMIELGNNGGNAFLDDIAKTLNKSVYFTDRPHRITMSGVYELPIGQNKLLLGNVNRFVDLVVGGWEMAGAYIFNSGRPWDLPGNTWYVKNAKNPDLSLDGRIIQGAIPCVSQMDNSGKVTMLSYSVAAGCTEPNFIVRPSFTERTIPLRDSHIRRPHFHQFDMNFAKNNRITERIKLQLRVELYNVFNTPMYDERNYVNDPFNTQFGQINKDSTRQSNFPRFIQLAAKIVF